MSEIELLPPPVDQATPVPVEDRTVPAAPVEPPALIVPVMVGLEMVGPVANTAGPEPVSSVK